MLVLLDASYQLSLLPCLPDATLHHMVIVMDHKLRRTVYEVLWSWCFYHSNRKVTNPVLFCVLTDIIEFLLSCQGVCGVLALLGLAEE